MDHYKNPTIMFLIGIGLLSAGSKFGWVPFDTGVFWSVLAALLIALPLAFVMVIEYSTKLFAATHRSNG